ncbi:MAG: ferritin-like fold-containing protein [Actinomycetota bacterium]
MGNGENDEAIGQLLAALTAGERLAALRARENADLAPDQRARAVQLGTADHEDRNFELVAARLAEVGSPEMTERFQPFFETFHEHTRPSDWVEAQTLHYVGDALVSEFAESLAGKLDPISEEVVRSVLGDREAEEAFALDELTRAMQEDPSQKERIALFARRISGEALTQTARALDAAQALRGLLGGATGEKLLLLELLENHRVRLDRLGIDVLEDAGDDDEL